MDLYFLFFQFGPAMKMIFNLSYIPKREDFKELTSAQYEAMYVKIPEDERKDLSNQKVLAFLPEDPKIYNKVVNVYGDNLVIVGEDEVPVFERASKVIDNYIQKSDRTFESMSEKLVYMAQCLPDVFSEETPYEIHAKLKRKLDKDRSRSGSDQTQQ